MNCQTIGAVSSYYNTVRQRTELCLVLTQQHECSDIQITRLIVHVVGIIWQMFRQALQMHVPGITARIFMQVIELFRPAVQYDIFQHNSESEMNCAYFHNK